jgi:hypothetical protein
VIVAFNTTNRLSTNPLHASFPTIRERALELIR